MVLFNGSLASSSIDEEEELKSEEKGECDGFLFLYFDMPRRLDEVRWFGEAGRIEVVVCFFFSLFLLGGGTFIFNLRGGLGC
jgi:hypothetical protein